jgi:hypothetical protein
MSEVEKIDKPQGNRVLPCVSGSFSMDEVKDLLRYGETMDLKVILKSQD